MHRPRYSMRQCLLLYNAADAASVMCDGPPRAVPDESEGAVAHAPPQSSSAAANQMRGVRF